MQANQLTTPPSLKVEDSAIEALIRWYCRESGVRNLEKHIEKLYRKVAYKVAGRVEEVSKTLKKPDAPAATTTSGEGKSEEKSGDGMEVPLWATETPETHSTGTVAIPPVPVVPQLPSDALVSLGVTTDMLFPTGEDWSITDKNLSEFVGKQIFTSDR